MIYRSKSIYKTCQLQSISDILGNAKIREETSLKHNKKTRRQTEPPSVIGLTAVRYKVFVDRDNQSITIYKQTFKYFKRVKKMQ